MLYGFESFVNPPIYETWQMRVMESPESLAKDMIGILTRSGSLGHQQIMETWKNNASFSSQGQAQDMNDSNSLRPKSLLYPLQVSMKFKFMVYPLCTISNSTHPPACLSKEPHLLAGLCKLSSGTHQVTNHWCEMEKNMFQKMRKFQRLFIFEIILIDC